MQIGSLIDNSTYGSNKAATLLRLKKHSGNAFELSTFRFQIKRGV